MSFPDAVLLATAAAAAGAVNAIGGGGSLISFPALLAAGYSPLSANVTNALAVLPGYLGGSVGYRPELRGQARRVASLALVSAAGGAGGALLLLVTPAEAFEAAAPILILVCCALLALQPRLARAATVGGAGPRSAALHLAVLGAALYGGYFSAGLGILLLAVLGLLLGDDLQRLNALKGVLSLVIGAIAALGFAIGGPVAWPAAGLMAGASYVGGRGGVLVARRLSAQALRWGVVTLGVGAALGLLAG